jgi:DNA repair exonuclease SbcCD ATPase subunit
MMKENESRRIINEEQKQRIEALESGLQRKAEELLELSRQMRNLVIDNKEAHAKIRQMNDALHKAQHTWNGSVAEVSGITEQVETRMKNFQAHQTRLLRDFSTNLNQFLENEMTAAQKSQTLLYDTLLTVENGRADSKTQPLKGETDDAFHELMEITEIIRGKVPGALNELSQASSRLVEGLQDGILECNNQVLPLMLF